MNDFNILKFAFANKFKINKCILIFYTSAVQLAAGE